uniref:Multidrug and toxin extrusion protein n=1 Tax=Echeneis naucrates TaxID=173247 RepID=A0A665UDN1_ECHNA
MGGSAPATRVRAPCGSAPAGRCEASLGTVSRFIPLDHRQEMRELVKLAGPVIISQLMVFMISIISMVFCGHLGKTELAGVSLAAAVVNVSGISIGTGLSSTCDTLISQTYGSGNLKRVGVILQRGILILLLACFPCWAVLINTEPLLLAVRQSPEVARSGIMWPQVITGAAGNVVNVIINYIFLYPLEWGVAGSAAANAISQYLLALFLYVYICWKNLHKATWGGWSLDCLQEWGPFVKLAISSMLMICLSWWIFETGGFLAGVINEVELGAQSIAYQLCIAAYMFPMGFSVAASVRVGNALGSGNTKQAKLSCKVPIMCSTKKNLSTLLSFCREIIKRVADVMLLFGFMHVGDATAGVAAGVLRGAGKQFFGALCNLVALYFIGFPIGVSLMFAANMGIVGLWTGLSICVSLQVIVFITFLCRLDWKKTTEEVGTVATVPTRKSSCPISNNFFGISSFFFFFLMSLFLLQPRLGIFCNSSLAEFYKISKIPP